MKELGGHPVRFNSGLPGVYPQFMRSALKPRTGCAKLRIVITGAVDDASRARRPAGHAGMR